MSSTTENGFGARVRKAQDVLIHISSLPVYNPPRQEESLIEIEALINEVLAFNTTEAVQKENYMTAADLRMKAFEKGQESVEKLMSPISAAVVAQFGKESKQAAMVSAIIKKVRGSKAKKAPEDPATGAKPAASQSETSYGAQTKSFSDLVSVLTQFPNYDPSNPALKVAALQQTAATLTQLNDDVTAKAGLLRTTRKERLIRYQQLSQGIQRIKAYLKAEYGLASNEYTAIKSIRI